jgi:hypothetical protein
MCRGYNDREVHGFQRLFWRDEPSGTLRSIEGFFQGPRRLLVGLRFCYEHGIHRQVGLCDGRDSESEGDEDFEKVEVRLADGEEFGRLDVAWCRPHEGLICLVVSAEAGAFTCPSQSGEKRVRQLTVAFALTDKQFHASSGRKYVLRSARVPTTEFDRPEPDGTYPPCPGIIPPWRIYSLLEDDRTDVPPGQKEALRWSGDEAAAAPRHVFGPPPGPELRCVGVWVHMEVSTMGASEGNVLVRGAGALFAVRDDEMA